MRYPLWAFLFVFVIPPFTAHALLAGGARVASQQAPGFSVATLASSEPLAIQTYHITR
jgi:hypothetical protein